MLRSALIVPLLLAACAASAFAQSYTIQPMTLQPNRKPGGTFSLSLRMIGSAKVTFGEVGTIDSGLDIGEATGLMTRVYSDGAVALDGRYTTDGTKVPDDGRTNSWGYGNASQVTNDGSGIAFHLYGTRSDGASVEAESGSNPGWDMEYAPCFGVFGGKLPDGSPAITWGGMAGVALSSVNANSRQTINTTLLTTTDYYSLDGAPAPAAPYSAPSTSTVSISTSGGTVNYTVDTTTLLENQPYRRIPEAATPGAAEIDGYWQVRGSYFTMRLGPWLRWKFSPRFSAKVSAGVTYSYLGLEMRYDEILVKDDIPENSMRDALVMEPEKYSLYGAYAALDAELWFTSTTCVFGGVAHEQLSSDINMSLGGRTAAIALSSSTGFRIGITKLF
jgi:hypothetical protein